MVIVNCLSQASRSRQICGCCEGSAIFRVGGSWQACAGMEREDNILYQPWGKGHSGLHRWATTALMFTQVSKSSYHIITRIPFTKSLLQTFESIFKCTSYPLRFTSGAPSRKQPRHNPFNSGFLGTTSSSDKLWQVLSVDTTGERFRAWPVPPRPAPAFFTQSSAAVCKLRKFPHCL